jgi:hypothetical protein
MMELILKVKKDNYHGHKLHHLLKSIATKGGVTKPMEVEVGLGRACDFHRQWNSLRVSGSRRRLP